jgi:catechol 2,3-dioxygenase-like lactoylglutathione lyase family enzyme
MLANVDITTTLPVKDLAAAREFYEGVLGLSPSKDMGEGGVLYKSGASTLLVYPSSFAGTNQGTAAYWAVDDVAEVAANLKESGVTFEHYPDMPDTTIDGDIHRGHGMAAVWFKDPTGNILSVGQDEA